MPGSYSNARKTSQIAVSRPPSGKAPAGYFTSDRAWTSGKDLLKCAAIFGGGFLTAELGIGEAIIAVGAAQCFPALMGDAFAPTDAANQAVHDVVNLMDPFGMALAVSAGLAGRQDMMLSAASFGSNLGDIVQFGARPPSDPTYSSMLSDYATIMGGIEEGSKALPVLKEQMKPAEGRAAKPGASDLGPNDVDANGDLRLGPSRITDDPRGYKFDKPGNPSSVTMDA